MKLKNNEHGMVMITVLVAIIVISILSVTILSSHVSQTQATIEMTKRIRANNFAKGLYWRCTEILRQDPAADCETDIGASDLTVVMDNIEYRATITLTPSGSSQDIDVQVDWD